MIDNFIRNEKLGEVLWESNGKKIKKTFINKIQAELVKTDNLVMVIASHKEVGAKNLFIFDEQGNIKLNPEMPILSSPVKGIYSVWYIPDNEEQKIILLTDENSPFDTACTLNFKTGKFYDFHRTK